MSNLLGQGQERFIVPLGNYTSDQSCNKLEYQTGQNAGGQKRASDVVVYGTFQLSTLNVIEAGSTQRIIKKTAHGARKNDVLMFTSGNNSSIAIQILSCPTVDTMILAATPEFTSAVGDAFDIKRYITPQYASDGSLSVSTAAPIFVPTYNESLVVANTGVITIAKPPLAKGCKVITPTGNAVNLHITLDGVTVPTTTVGGVGMEIQPGRAEDFLGVGDLKVICQTVAVAQKISVHWFA